MPRTTKAALKRARIEYDLAFEQMVKAILRRAELYAEQTMEKGYVLDLKGPDKDQALEIVAEVVEEFDQQITDAIRKQAGLTPETKITRYTTQPKE